jgi:hypothetical protein
MVVYERLEDIPEARDLPPAAQAAWRRFRASPKRSADEHGIDMQHHVWNAIRNAWRDGYWTGRDTT